MPRRIALIATSLALLVVLAGCGSDDDSADERDSATTTEEESSTTKAEDEPEESTAPDEPTTEATEPTDTTDTTAPEDETPPAFEVPEGADFCAAYAAFEASFQQVPSDTVEGMQTGTAILRDAIAALAPLAPEELSDHIDLLLQATEDMAAAAAEATTVEDAQAALSEGFTNPDFAAAGEALDTYFNENCEEANDEQADEAEAPETVTPG